ncbi:unnamed protein product [Cyprideis torosa]|uniref:Uncharacterized protein n=1 Tax=Cyprideis torosa TaxID=163714 RepID=A0A7R8W530_9CRUS|nr:unnamed protein product [Cyprideis torosa]CAG0884788.1 unnamed protein product [Cyprideis torosa]
MAETKTDIGEPFVETPRSGTEIAVKEEATETADESGATRRLFYSIIPPNNEFNSGKFISKIVKYPEDENFGNPMSAFAMDNDKGTQVILPITEEVSASVSSVVTQTVATNSVGAHTQTHVVKEGIEKCEGTRESGSGDYCDECGQRKTLATTDDNCSQTTPRKAELKVDGTTQTLPKNNASGEEPH